MSNLIELRKIMLEHQKADQLVQGGWWNSEEKKGCFYGCAVHENDEYAIEKAIQKFGIEPWIAYWSEQVFEGLPQKLALNWPVELLDAMIQFEGEHYKEIYHKLSIKRLENLPNTNDKNVNQAIEKVIEYHLNPTEDKRKEALSAARIGVRWAAADSAAHGRHVRRQVGGMGGTFGGVGGKNGTCGTFSGVGGRFGGAFTTLGKRTQMDA